MNKLEILVTTLKKSHSEMLDLFYSMKIKCSAIIRSQGFDEYSKKENYVDGFKVITIEANDLGASKSRNEMLKLATSEYVYFADDDIVFFEDSVDKFKQLVDNHDCNVFYVNITKNGAPISIIEHETRKKINPRHCYSLGAWGFVIKREFLLNNNITFNECLGPGCDFYCGEDSLFIKSLTKTNIFSTGFIFADIHPGQSTWFEGKTNKYYYVRGGIYYLLHKKTYALYYLKTAFKEKNLSIIRTMYRGKREIKRASRTNTNPTSKPINEIIGQVKPLIITSSALKKESSNGRTIINLCSLIETKNRCSLFIENTAPDYTQAKSFYRITDSEILKSFFLKRVGGIVKNEKPSNTTNSLKTRKTIAKVIIRDLLWSISNVKNKALRNWININNPNCIIFQCGDFPYLNNLVKWISLEYKIPLFIYNTEEYLIKNHNYIDKKINNGLLFPIFKHRLVTSYKKLAKDSVFIHLTPNIQKIYDCTLNTQNTYFIYNSSQINNTAKQINDVKDVYYFGNIGLGRLNTLIKIYKTLLRYKQMNFHIFSRCSNVEIEIIRKNGISYEGFVPYDELIKKLQEKADLIIHCESDEKYYLLDSKNAFSTKIPDLLSLGVPVLFYGSRELYFIQYLESNGIPNVFHSLDELENFCSSKLTGYYDWSSDIASCINLAKANHSIDLNAQKMIEIIKRAN